MGSEHPRAHHPPDLGPATPGKGRTGAMIMVVVGFCVLLTLSGAAAAVFVLFRGPPKSEVWVDNLTAERLSVEIDGSLADTVEPRGTEGAVRLIRVPDGKRTVRVLGADGAVKDERTLSLKADRLIYAVGGPAQYAVVTVHYARPGAEVEPDSAKLLPRIGDGALWQMPLSSPVEAGIDRQFPETSKRPALRHVCRVTAGKPQCEGGPETLTSAERFFWLGTAD